MSKHTVCFRVCNDDTVKFMIVTESEIDVDMPQDRIIRACDDLARKLKRNSPEDAVAYFVDDELMYFAHKSYFQLTGDQRGSY